MGSRFGAEANEAAEWNLAVDVPNQVGVLIATDTALNISGTLGGSEQLDLVNQGFQAPYWPPLHRALVTFVKMMG